MSTGMQIYSIQNQMEAIALYAARRGLTIVRTYEDAGKSGIGIEGREALRSLMRDVRSGMADFSTILVYDVSRWGRFQDADESAYYEYLCKDAGVAVEYCAEQFANDGSLVSTLLKNIKRVMAAEFSRDLSTKVFAGLCRSASNGHYVGSSPGYALRRFVIDDKGRPRMALKAGDRKAITTDRTILVPGPAEEVRVVHEIYDMLIDKKLSMNEISRSLNSRGILNSSGREWQSPAIREILTNPKYAGSAVYARTARKFKTKMVKRARSEWIVKEGAFEGLVSVERFRDAERQLKNNSRAYTEAELLDSLTALWCREGRLNAGTIENDRYSPCVNTYKEHFGGVVPAYRKIGYCGNFQRGRAPQMRKDILERVSSEIMKRGGSIARDRDCMQVCVNDELEIAIVAGCSDPACGKNQWHLRRRSLNRPDLLVAARVNDKTAEVIEFLFIPLLLLPNESWLSVTKRRLEKMKIYRFKTMDLLFSLCERKALQDVS
ncbi:MAG: recombinase family protein [Rhizobiales bacterium]|nr:recombinase family protein [Hyphomicrobiales bacterium]